MLALSEETVIDAPAGTIFEVITDLPRYAQWNPWIVAASGTPAAGQVVRVKSKMRGRTIAVEHRILANDPGRTFRWCDLGWFTRLAYGERARWLEPREDGRVAYRCELRVTGVAARLVQAIFGDALAEGLRAETAALKQRAETLHRQAQ